MTDREKMISRLKKELRGAEIMADRTDPESESLMYMWRLGVMSGLSVVLGWYEEIGADGKAVFRK